MGIDGKFDAVKVTIKYPKIKQSPWLALRLGTNITYQRQRLSHIFLSKNVSARPKTQAFGIFRGSASTSSLEMEDVNNDAVISDMEDYQDMPPKDESSADVETSKIPSALTTDGNIDLRVPALTEMWLAGTQLQYNAHIQCPCCGVGQIFKNRSDWE